MFFKHDIRLVQVEVTDRCNSECPACLRGNGPLSPYVKNIELRLPYFTDLLGEDFCKKINVWTFCGNLGDPSAAIDFVSIVKFLFDCNPDAIIDIRTNGGARNTKFWEELGTLFKNKKAGGVVWSIDGLEDTNHIYRRNVKWNKVWENFNAYFDVAGNRGSWEFLKFGHNEHQISDIQEICNSKGIELVIKDPHGFASSSDNVYTMPVYNRIANKDNEHEFLYEIMPSTEFLGERKLIKSNRINALDITSEVSFNYELINQKIKQYPNSTIKCPAKETEYDLNTYGSEIYIDADGKVYPCCFHASRLKTGDYQLNKMYEDIDLLLSESNPLDKILSNKLFNIVDQGINGTLGADHSMTESNHCITCLDSCNTDQTLQGQLFNLKDDYQV